MEPSNSNILPSHEVLHKLALMRQFQEDKGDMPELFIFDNIVEVKVKEQAKSFFESWTSKEEWKNWLSWQQPGLKSLPSLLNKTIHQLKSEFTDEHSGDYKLKETIKELEMAYNGLDKVRSFKSLDSTTLKIINQAMIDIHKLQENFTTKYEGKEGEESKDLGVAYYIPKTILVKMGKIDEKNLKEAEEIVGNLQLLLKNEISIKTFIKLKSILEKDKDPNLKSMIKLSLKGDMGAFGAYHQINLSVWDVSYDDSLKIKNLLNKLLFNSFIVTSETGLKLKNLLNNPDFQFSAAMTEQTAHNILDPEKHELLNQFLEYYQFKVIFNFLQTLPDDGQDLTLKSLKSAIEDFNDNAKNADLQVISQFKKDYLRKMEFERTDAYHKIVDERAVPHDFKNLDERLVFAANAIQELCLPDNEHNQRFIPVIQMAVTQMSLAVFGAAEGSFHQSYFYTWSDGTDEFRWETTNDAKIKIEVIHGSLGDIEKVNVEVKGGVHIIEKNTSTEFDESLPSTENKIVIKDAIFVKFNYSMKFDNDGALQIEDYDCKYNISLK